MAAPRTRRYVSHLLPRAGLTVVACAAVVTGLVGCAAAPQQLSPQALAAHGSSAADHSDQASKLPSPTPSSPRPGPSRSTPDPVPTPRSSPPPTTASRRPVPAVRTQTPRTRAATPSRAATSPRPVLLPDRMADTDGAGQIVAVTNGGTGTDATLRAYQNTGGRWGEVIGPFGVKIGAGGFSQAVSEQTVSSPVGYFTLTQAFGNDADPGTRLPYHHVAYGDVWVDQSTSANYNTMQTADADGSKGTGEKLWQVVPLYDYAIVVDYNRSPIRPGAGSAFFLHVTDGRPTAGCVSMPVGDLLQLLRWLDPARAPRIAMGPEADVLRQ